MPRQKRIKTKYPGIYFVEVDGKAGRERIYYIRYRKQGKAIEEKAGFQFADDMTPAKANQIRAERVKGELSNTEKREKVKAEKQAEAKKPTLSRLWNEYQTQRPDSISIKFDGYRFDKYLKPKYGNKTPSELHQLDIDRLRITLLKTKAPQTVKHVLNLLKRLCNFGVKKQLCEAIKFKIEMPRVDNQRTEDLSPDELKSLLEAIEASPDVIAATFMKMALFTGMRRGELIKLKWKDVDFQRGFIHIKDPKGGVSMKIPLNPQAKNILENHPETSEYIFARDKGLPLTNAINKRVRAIRKAAGLPNDFRPLHGLRHAYASMLASSGQVDMYTLQKLLTHKSPIMTQRYAHLRDDALKNAAAVAGKIIEKAAEKEKDRSDIEVIGA